MKYTKAIVYLYFKLYKVYIKAYGVRKNGEKETLDYVDISFAQWTTESDWIKSEIKTLLKEKWGISKVEFVKVK